MQMCRSNILSDDVLVFGGHVTLRGFLAADSVDEQDFIDAFADNYCL